MRRLLWSVLWDLGDWCYRTAFSLYDLDEVPSHRARVYHLDERRNA